MMQVITTGEKCQWCGQMHDVRCPFVRAIEYHEDGSIRRVEFMRPADYVMPASVPPPQPVPVAPSPVMPYWPNTAAPGFAPAIGMHDGLPMMSTS